MKNIWHYVVVSVSVLIVTFSANSQTGNKAFMDPLDTPAVRDFGFRGLTSQPVMAMSKAGKRIVAVGLRGLVIFSDDGGQSWQQAHVPVQTDLVAVQFVNASQGWATGHDAVILHSEDGGQTWVKQMDSHEEAIAFPKFYASRVANGDATADQYLKEVKLNTEGDTSLPFLSVYFADPQHGIAVGSFGMIVATTDGGRHWEPWLDHIDNKAFLNLNAIKKIGDDLVVVGEQGSVYRYDAARQYFVSVGTPYKGSFFDVTGTSRFWLAVGLRGTIFRSTDQGATWHQVDSQVKDSFTSAQVFSTGSTTVLTTAGGTLLSSHDNGLTFNALQVLHPGAFTALDMLDARHFLLASLQGLSVEQVAGQNVAATHEVSQ